jgi:hypothetical protein
MPRKSKIERGFYPISYKDIKRKIGYCNTWGYGNKDTCKYVAESLIEEISINHELPITDTLNSDLISITHDINSGARYHNQELLLPYNN